MFIITLQSTSKTAIQRVIVKHTDKLKWNTKKHVQWLEIQEKNKSKASKRKEITKIRVKIKRKINETKTLFFVFFCLFVF